MPNSRIKPAEWRPRAHCKALKAIVANAGCTCTLWECDNIRRLYINEGRKPLGYIDMHTKIYNCQRREGGLLWSALRKAGLING